MRWREILLTLLYGIKTCFYEVNKKRLVVKMYGKIKWQSDFTLSQIIFDYMGVYILYLYFTCGHTIMPVKILSISQFSQNATCPNPRSRSFDFEKQRAPN